MSATEIASRTFDFASFKEAFERRDLARWKAFYADDAEWIEYQPGHSSREPHRMRGKQQIATLLHRKPGRRPRHGPLMIDDTAPAISPMLHRTRRLPLGGHVAAPTFPT